MRISAKGRYGLAAMVCLAQDSQNSDYTTIISIAKRLGISKIYLEQVFALFKRAMLVDSSKGAGGGYRLARSSGEITVFEVFEAIEQTLFEKVKPSLSADTRNIEQAVEEAVYDQIDQAILDVVTQVTLADLVTKAEENGDGSIMFYI